MTLGDPTHLAAHGEFLSVGFHTSGVVQAPTVVSRSAPVPVGPPCPYRAKAQLVSNWRPQKLHLEMGMSQ